jgi:hypothetical protein
MGRIVEIYPDLFVFLRMIQFSFIFRCWSWRMQLAQGLAITSAIYRPMLTVYPRA